MKLSLLHHGEVYTPQPQGQQALWLAGSQIVKVGTIDNLALEAVDLDLEVIDVTGCVVVPGFIDPHEHLIGAGEKKA